MIKEITLHYSYLNEDYPLARHHEISAELEDGNSHRLLVVVDEVSAYVYSYKKRGYLPEDLILSIGHSFLKSMDRYRIKHIVNPYIVEARYI